MPKTKEQKKEIIKDLKEKFDLKKSVVFIDFTGLDSKFLFKLRKELKQSNCLLRVIKKTLLKKFFEQIKKTGFTEQVQKLEGELALVFSFSDEITPYKLCGKFSKENKKLKILGGIFENNFIEKETALELACLPSKEELLAKLVGSLKAPISNFLNVISYNLKGLIFVLAKLKT